MPKPYRVLFLSASVGSGHLRAAEALEAAFVQTYGKRLRAKIIDAFGYTSPLLSKMVVNTYMEMIKLTPSVYRYLYKRAERSNSMTEFSSLLNKIMSTRLKRLIIDFRPDVVICTHVFPCAVMSVLKKKTRLRVPVVGVITDFTVHNFWVYPNVDLYTVANEELKRELLIKGIDEEKIAVTGIPIHPKFAEKNNKMLIYSHLKLAPKLPVLTVMGGGFGFGPLVQIVKELNKLDLPVQIVVIVGKNKMLLRKIAELRTEFRFPLTVLGYINNVHEIMEVSDLLITKPGGLTTSEALSKGLPIVIMNPIPGQEEKNTDFLLRSKAAVKVKNVKSLNLEIKKMLIQPGLLQRMKAETQKIAYPDSASLVVSLIEQLYFPLGGREDKIVD